MQTKLSACCLISIFLGKALSDFQIPNGFGFNNKDPRYYIKIKRIICDGNPPSVKLTHCIMKLERNTNGQHSVGYVFSGVEKKMTLKVTVFRRSSANIYRLTPLQQSMDLCEFIANKNRPSIVTMFVPTFFQIVQIPDCPFKEKIEFNFSVPMLYVDPALGITGDHKLVLNVTRNSGVYLFSIGIEVFVKGSRMLK